MPDFPKPLKLECFESTNIFFNKNAKIVSCNISMFSVKTNIHIMFVCAFCANSFHWTKPNIRFSVDVGVMLMAKLIGKCSFIFYSFIPVFFEVFQVVYELRLCICILSEAG